MSKALWKKTEYDPEDDEFSEKTFSDPFSEDQGHETGVEPIDVEPISVTPGNFKTALEVKPQSDFKHPFPVPQKTHDLMPRLLFTDPNYAMTEEGKERTGFVKHKFGRLAEGEDMVHKIIEHKDQTLEIYKKVGEEIQRVHVIQPKIHEEFIQPKKIEVATRMDFYVFPIIETWHGNVPGATSLSGFYFGTHFIGAPKLWKKGEDAKKRYKHFADSPWYWAYDSETHKVLYENLIIKPGEGWGKGPYGEFFSGPYGDVFLLKEPNSIFYATVRELKPMGEEWMEDSFTRNVTDETWWYPQAEYTRYGQCQACCDPSGSQLLDTALARDVCPCIDYPTCSDFRCVHGGVLQPGLPDPEATQTTAYFASPSWMQDANILAWVACHGDNCHGGALPSPTGDDGIYNQQTTDVVTVEGLQIETIGNQVIRRKDTEEVILEFEDYVYTLHIIDTVHACHNPWSENRVAIRTTTGDFPWHMMDRTVRVEDADISKDRWILGYAMDDYQGEETYNGPGSGWYASGHDHDVEYGYPENRPYPSKVFITTDEMEPQVLCETTSEDDYWFMDMKVFNATDEMPCQFPGFAGEGVCNAVPQPWYMYSFYSRDKGFFLYGMIVGKKHYQVELPLFICAEPNETYYYHKFETGTWRAIHAGKTKAFSFPKELQEKNYVGWGYFRGGVISVRQEAETFHADKSRIGHDERERD